MASAYERMRRGHTRDIREMISRAKRITLTQEVPDYMKGIARTPEERRYLEERLTHSMCQTIGEQVKEYLRFSSEYCVHSHATRCRGSLVVMRTEDYEEMLRAFDSLHDLVTCQPVGWRGGVRDEFEK